MKLYQIGIKVAAFLCFSPPDMLFLTGMKPVNPVIIPRAEHSVSRSLLSPNAVRVLYRLSDHGFIAYLVGGCVRDLLLGREPKDFDVVTNATPNQIKKLFRNCRLIGRRFRLAHLHFQDEIIEVATFRSKAPGETEDEPQPEASDTPAPDAAEPRRRHPEHLKSADGMILRDNVFGTPEEDALRRDFTVNALFYNIADFSIIDYAGGMEDLSRGIIRIIDDPFERFTEDPVRMIRAVRFAAMLGFNIENLTWRAILELGDTITRAAPARLFEEVLKLFLAGCGERTYQLLRQTGLFAALFPHFNNWLAEETDGFPHTRVGQALDWIDDRIRMGEKVSPQVFLALMSGRYIEEKGEHHRRAGVPPQQSLDLAVAEFLGELAPTVMIPHKTGILVRNILAYQHRFRKTPGKHPLSFIGRPGFGDAVDYLRFDCGITGKNRDALSWWESFIQANPLPPNGGQAGEQAPKPSTGTGRRKRRRRRSHGREKPGEGPEIS
ncbi:MAG: poly(A) [Geobacteraceae bacterium]|nr:MAG: poly(A) [Geobacteraceae bacterium]